MMRRLLWLCLLAACGGHASAKWVEGRLDTKENWAFLARFCFLSIEGQFEYSIEYPRSAGTPNLLLYYDDESQWPSVYRSEKTCKEREAVLNKAGQNQVIPLSHWYPDTELSGCVLRSADHDLPATKSSTTTFKPATHVTPEAHNSSKRPTEDPTYYHQFLKTTDPAGTTESANVTWYEVTSTPEDNGTTTEVPEGQWETLPAHANGTEMSNDLKDVELLFGDATYGNHKKIKRSFEISERLKRRRLTGGAGSGAEGAGGMSRLVVHCHNARRFRSARERWWFIAVSNCDSPNGLDISYKFLMTNGAEGDFWHEHFSADEFYVLPVLLAYMLAYLLLLIAVAMCSVELKTRHLLHSTYKLFVLSVVMQQSGIFFMSMAYARYAVNGIGNDGVKVVGQFMCGVSEMLFLLVLVLMAKGYTITRARLRVSFTVKLTVFMCCYVVTYILLFVYQAQSFDPGAVLYLYESPAGYGLVILRIVAWFMFVYATIFTVKKFPEKSMFYCPFSICGSLWFYAGPLFVLTANSYVDKWVRESVVTAVLLFISFAGHVTFLLLTLPVFANKNFPYHVRTTQIGIMEVAGGGDSFAGGMYQPAEVTHAQTVIIPLTRRTEELIGNMYSQYMASAPPLSLEDDNKLSSGPLAIAASSPRILAPQHISHTNISTDRSSDVQPNGGASTNTNGDANSTNANSETRQMTAGNSKSPTLNNKDLASVENGVFSVESQMAKLRNEWKGAILQNGHGSFGKSSTDAKSLESSPFRLDSDPKDVKDGTNGVLMGVNLKSRRTLLEPIGRKYVPPPSWSLAKGPAQKIDDRDEISDKGVEPESAGATRKTQRDGARHSADISTAHGKYEAAAAAGTLDVFASGHTDSTPAAASTLQLFAAGQRK